MGVLIGFDYCSKKHCFSRDGRFIYVFTCLLYLKVFDTFHNKLGLKGICIFWLIDAATKSPADILFNISSGGILQILMDRKLYRRPLK